MNEAMLNADQEAYVRYLDSIPPHQLCVCGWNLRKDCEGGYMEKHCTHKTKVLARLARERGDDIQ